VAPVTYRPSGPARWATIAAIKHRLDDGVRAGELPADTDTAALALFYATVHSGLSIAGRAQPQAAAFGGRNGDGGLGRPRIPPILPLWLAKPGNSQP
jgi:hypothetical protein